MSHTASLGNKEHSRRVGDGRARRDRTTGEARLFAVLRMVKSSSKGWCTHQEDGCANPDTQRHRSGLAQGKDKPFTEALTLLGHDYARQPAQLEMYDQVTL